MTKTDTISEKKVGKKTFQTNCPKSEAGEAILISNKVNFQPKVIKKNKEGHFLLITGETGQEKLSILNIYAPNKKSTHLHERNPTKAQKIYFTLHNNSGRL